jgi:cytochrome c
MKDLEPNKIFAALLVAGIVAGLSGFIATKVTKVAPLEHDAYKIDGVASADSQAAPVVQKPQPILDLIASADVARGEQISKVCASCHVFTEGGPNGMGPNLYGVVGRKKGSHPGFDYSAGMKAKGGSWTMADLNEFLYKPSAYVPGTKMTFVGLKKPEDRAAIIAFLRTLSEHPVPEPTAAEIAAEKAALAPPAAPSDDKAKAEGTKEGAKEGAKPAEAAKEAGKDATHAAAPVAGKAEAAPQK